MSLLGLVIRNLRRNIKDYVIYVITVTLALSLVFAFNLVGTSREVINLGRIMHNFLYVMYVVNAFMVVATCFLVNYIVKFIFRKRSREIGTYALLGIKKVSIKRMIALENIILGLFSFLLAIPGGYLISIFVAVILRNIFDLHTLLKIDFSFKALVLLCIYFGVIYGIVLLLQKHRTKNLNIHNLIYYDKQNEERFWIRKLYKVVFGISLVLIFWAMLIFDKQFRVVDNEPNMAFIFLTIGLLVIGIYGIAITIVDFIFTILLNKPSFKYRKENLILGRNFVSSIKTMSLTMGTLMVLLTITLIALNISSLFKGVFDYQLERNAPYDIAIEDSAENIETYLDFIKEKYTINDSVYYHSYINQNKNVLNVLDKRYIWRNEETVITLSDYNTALRLKGDKAVTLGDDEYILHVSRELLTDLKGKEELDVILLSNGIELKQKELLVDGYTSTWGYGYGFLIVVPDGAVEGLDIANYYLLLDTLEETSEADAIELKKLINSDLCRTDPEEGYEYCYSLGNIVVRGEVAANNNGFVSIISLVAFYIAIVFTAIVGTILAVQIIDRVTKNKYQYQILRKMGVREKRIKALIFKQLAIFFLFPLFLPIIISFLLMTSMNKLFRVALVGDYVYLSYFGGSLLIFLLIYAIYFGGAYFGFKKNVRG